MSEDILGATTLGPITSALSLPLLILSAGPFRGPIVTPLGSTSKQRILVGVTRESADHDH